MIRNKKATGIGDYLNAFIFLIVGAVTFLIVLSIMNSYNDGWQESSATDLSKERSETVTNNYSESADTMIVVWFFLLYLAILVSSYFLDNNPVFFIIFFIVALISFFILPPLSNFVYEFSNSPSLIEFRAMMPMTMFLVDNILIVAAFFVCSIFVTLYVKRREGV